MPQDLSETLPSFRAVRINNKENSAGKEAGRGVEKKLSLLFDYQKFAQNPELQRVIDKVHARFSKRELSDEEADLVAAAGQPEMASLRKKPREKENDEIL